MYHLILGGSYGGGGGGEGNSSGHPLSMRFRITCKQLFFTHFYCPLLPLPIHIMHAHQRFVLLTAYSKTLKKKHHVEVQ